MGGQNVGNLNATLSLADFEFINGLKRSSSQLSEFAGETEQAAIRANNAMTRTGGGGNILGNRIQQIGYAAQDFTSQLDRGLGPALAATTNNTMMLAAALPPMFAALATGALIALPFVVTYLEKQGLLWKSNKKELEDFTEAWKKQQAEFTSKRQDDREALRNPVKQLDDKQQSRKDRQADIEAEVKDANRQILLMEAGVTSTDNIWWQKAQVMRKQVDEKIAEWKKIDADIKRTEKLRPDVITNEAIRNQEELKKQQEKAEAERLNKGVQESQKLQLQALETYGTASQKLTAKQRREREELSMRMRGLVEEESSLALQAAGHEVEKQKLKISETEAAIAKLGQEPGMSSGLRSDSAEGISQSNKWAQGDNGKSVLQEQLEVQKKQLSLMEQQARGETLSTHEKNIMNNVSEEPILGPVAGKNTVPFNGGNGNRFVAPQQQDAVKAALEQVRLLTELVAKPISKVVGL